MIVIPWLMERTWIILKPINISCITGICLLLQSDMNYYWQIAGSDKFAKVTDFLCRQLHRETLFVYVNSAFSPNPDEMVIDLYNNHGFDGKLVVNYACSMAWG